MHLGGEGKLCHRAREPWTMGSGQCVPNSPADRFVFVPARVKRRSHSDRDRAYSASLSRSVALHTSLCVPLAGRWSGVRGCGRAGGLRQWRRGQEGWREERGEQAEGRFQSVSLAGAPQHWNARSLLYSLFWEVSPLAGAVLTGLLSNGRVHTGGAAEEHEGREAERLGNGRLLN